jgi:hypothetical protein
MFAIVTITGMRKWQKNAATQTVRHDATAGQKPAQPEQGNHDG